MQGTQLPGLGSSIAGEQQWSKRWKNLFTVVEFSSLLSWNHVTFSWSCCCWWLGRAGKEIDIYSGAETNKASSAPAHLTYSAVRTKTREALLERKLHKALSSDLLSECWSQNFQANLWKKSANCCLEAPTISFGWVLKLLPKSNKKTQLQSENLAFMFFSKGKKPPN